MDRETKNLVVDFLDSIHNGKIDFHTLETLHNVLGNEINRHHYCEEYKDKMKMFEKMEEISDDLRYKLSL